MLSVADVRVQKPSESPLIYNLQNEFGTQSHTKTSIAFTSVSKVHYGTHTLSICFHFHALVQRAL